ncbi:pimeloyl-ACP methyl ester carboxylesterase [Bradyrhizobium elkanii]
MVDWSNPSPNSCFVKAAAVRVHFKRAGSGPVILLLHGSGSSMEGFELVAALLSRSCTVVRPDLPGFGRTGPRPDRDCRIEAYVATMAAFMAALDVKRYSVAGNSLGGNIAWNLALRHPERLDALVLINATGYPEKSQPAGLRLARNPLLRPLLRRWLPRGATQANLRSIVGQRSTIVDDAMVDRVHGLMSLPGNRSAFVDLANTNQTDRSAEIPRIVTPNPGAAERRHRWTAFRTRHPGGAGADPPGRRTPSSRGGPDLGRKRHRRFPERAS